ncbi:MAG: hypothetical protein DIU78_016755 [Pseudomonadota bacterium]|nr:MAG: hypothetical protein DIU78_03785 [Pseudomonadota bacterium]
MRRLATPPAELLDGRYHESALAAVNELEEKIARAGGWLALVPDVPSPNGPSLEQHGLSGPEWVLKFQAFDHQFQLFLDRMAQLESVVASVSARVTEIEVADFKARVRGARDTSRAVLEHGEPILESAAKVIPGGEYVLGSIKEMIGIFKGLVYWGA